MPELSTSEVAALRASGQALLAAFQVGKAGVTEGVVKELQNHLGRDPLVKVKFARGARAEGADTRALAEELARLARVRLVEVRGHTALFYRAPRNKRDPGEF